MLPGGLTVRCWPLRGRARAGPRAGRRTGRSRTWWSSPTPHAGPVLVTVAATRSRRSNAGRVRRGDGGGPAGPGSAPARPAGACSARASTADRFVEVYLVPSWDEHLRQHGGRLTGADQATEEHAPALAEGDAARSPTCCPRTDRLLLPDTAGRAPPSARPACPAVSRCARRERKSLALVVVVVVAAVAAPGCCSGSGRCCGSGRSGSGSGRHPCARRPGPGRPFPRSCHRSCCRWRRRPGRCADHARPCRRSCHWPCRRRHRTCR